MAALAWGTPTEYEEIIAFADRVFGEEGGFEALVPRIYAGNPEAARWHLLLREQGELLGLLLCAPGVMHTGESVLPFSCIGTVAVAPEARGRGHMGTLLREAERIMRARGDVFAALGGQRQRYEHYGYFPAGLGLRVEVTGANLREGDGTLLETAPCDGWLPQMQALHTVQPVWCERPRFAPALHAWGAGPVALLRQGELCGYAAVERAGDTTRCTELLLADPALARAACRALLGEGKSLTLWAPLYNRPLANELAAFAEQYAIGTAHSFAIYNAPRLAAALAPLQPRWQAGLPNTAAPESIFGPRGLLQGLPVLPLWLPAPDAC